ncbi:MAG: amino acid adenylation domain-containing protein, partial [Pseudomonadota bacterium]
QAEQTVGILMSRRIDMLVAILAVLKSDGCYVPLDPDYPAKRLGTIIQDADIKLILCDDHTSNSTLAKDINLLDVSQIDWTSAELISVTLPIPIAEQLAYIIYTSGSTGNPKGVAIEHRNTVAMLDWARTTYSDEDLSVVLASTSICFDLSIYELFLPLICGSRVHIVTNALSLAEADIEPNLTLINTVPSVLSKVITQACIPRSIKVVNLAGEPLTTRLIGQLQELGHIDRVYNLYGPSEDTTYSTWACFDLSQPIVDKRVPIGVPITGTEAYVLDDNLQLVPDGISGQLYLSGLGVARGYHGQKKLTDIQFIHNPFHHNSSDVTRMYATGDRVRRRRDGMLEYQGRIDNQVKIRGYRIEIGEIEATLNQFPEIIAVNVLVKKSEDNSHLVAYLESSASNPPEQSELREFLQARLPAWSIPAHFILLDSMPRLPNGKLDRKALENLATPLTSKIKFRKPETITQKQLARIWASLLNIEQVSLDDNFFALGGHSLLALDLVARCQTEFGCQIPLRTLFEAATLATFARRIEEFVSNRTGDYIQYQHLPELKPAPEDNNQPFPLTDIQMAYLLGRDAAFELGQISTHGYREIEISNIVVKDVESSLNKLIQRHDMLRVVIDGDQQRILSDVPALKIKEHFLQDKSKNDQQISLQSISKRLSHQMFDTSQWPLFTIEASHLNSNRIRFHLSFDVLIGDAWSFQILGREMATLLLGHELNPLSLKFRDYVLAEHHFKKTNTYLASLEYWNNKLHTLPSAPELPLVKTPSEIESPHFIRQSGVLDKASWIRLKEHSKTFGITASTTVLTVFAEVLAAFSSKPSFTLNLTLFNRLNIHPEVNQILGDFTASLLHGINYMGDRDFIVNAQAMQNNLWQDLEHRFVSGVHVQRELARSQQRSGAALMPVVFTSTLNQSSTPSAPKEWEADFVDGISQTSQVYLDHQISEIDGCLHFNWDVIEELFFPGFIEQMNDVYVHRLEALSKDKDAWNKPLTYQQYANWLPAYNQSNFDFGKQATLSLDELFFESAKQNPEHIAIVCNDRELS